MRRLYTIVLGLLLPLVLLRLFWRGRRSPGYRQRWEERLGRLPPLAAGKVIWVHAVSVGEAQAAQPLIRRLLADYPSYRVFVTTTTPTGADRVRRLFDGEVVHRYFPYDLPGIVHDFLDAVHPDMVLVMETEIWPNLLAECQRRAVPVMLVNARLSARSARGYGWFGDLTRESLQRIRRIAVQSPEDGERFVELGAPRDRVAVTGSLKFDIRLPASVGEQAEVLRLGWGMDRPVWVAASTHEGEEPLVLDAHERVLAQCPDALLVLVPRHPERFDEVAQLVADRGFDSSRRSDQPAPRPACQVYVGDTMGELPVFYAAADVAYVGGSLVPVGGHNILEPAALGVPVVFGPHMFNFAAIGALFLDQQAARQASDEQALAEVIVAWMADSGERARIGDNGRRVVAANRGALDTTMGLVAEILTEEA
jgi:3-deoxy-D-manno-octulosonic-acid transferase